MTKERIHELLATSLKSLQELSGEESPTLNPDVEPIGDLPGFDSQRAVEATVMLEGSLGVQIPGEVNLFVSKDGTRALKIKDIVNRIHSLVTTKEDSTR